MPVSDHWIQKAVLLSRLMMFRSVAVKLIVYPGDIIYADYDGIVVVPKQAEKDVFIKAERKSKKRKPVAKGIAQW